MSSKMISSFKAEFLHKNAKILFFLNVFSLMLLGRLS